MEYIPMDWSVFLPYLFGSIVLALLFVGYILFGVMGKLKWLEKTSRPVLGLVSFVVALSFLGSLGLFLWGLMAPGNKLADDAREQIRATYGLELSSQEVASLRYPDSRPEGDAVGYGSVEIFLRDGDDFIRSEVFLVGSRGKLYLADSQGERLKLLTDDTKPSAEAE